MDTHIWSLLICLGKTCWFHDYWAMPMDEWTYSSKYIETKLHASSIKEI